MKKCVVVGAGFSGLSVASYLLKYGFEVTIIEKHDMSGGRAKQWKHDGFTFDMGPSWYWMPDVFEHFFSDFGKKVSDFYELKKMQTAYRVFWKEGFTDISNDYEQIRTTYESIEKGAGNKLDKLMKEAEIKYNIGMGIFVKKPSLSIFEFLNYKIFANIFKLNIFKSIRSLTKENFKNDKLRMLFEFPILFLGGLPNNTPSLYSLMNYADYKLHTWYPKGGMYEIIKAMEKTILDLGGKFVFNKNIKEVSIKKNNISSLITDNSEEYEADIVVFSADYHHVDTQILPKKYRNYSETYWNKRKMAPSSILFYLGLNKKIPSLCHHNLFFDEDFDAHAQTLYNKTELPRNPLFYVNVPSKTDPTVCPSKEHETMFVLIPTPSNVLNITKEIIDKYFNDTINRIYQKTKVDIKPHIVYKKIYTPANFYTDYNAFQGNAYGLANTLLQTAMFKPKCISKKLKNTFYTGQLTVPGPGVPPSIISGEIVAKLIKKKFAECT